MTTEASVEEILQEFTVESGQQWLIDFEHNLNEYVPNPTNRRILQGDVEYSTDELQSMLQEFGSYISNLSALEGKMLAQENILKKGYKQTLQVALGGYESRATSVSGKESEFLASEQGIRFRKIAGDIIQQESCLMLVQGWLKAYKEAYIAVSRVVTLVTSEQEM